MDMTVGIRRPVVQNIKGFVLRRFLDLGIEILFFPALQTHRFSLRQVGLHVERRLGQVECRPVIHNCLLGYIVPVVLVPG